MRKYLPANLFGEKTLYVVSSGFVSAIGFIKSFVFLRYFDFGDLGLINLSQNFTISISLLQIGVVTGSYRLFSYKKEPVLARINSTVLAYFFFLIGAILVVSLVAASLYNFDLAWYWIVYFTLTGALGLYANWVNCKLIAKRKIDILNKANLISAALSFSVIFFAYYAGVAAALISFSIQYGFVIWFAYAKAPELVPQVRFKGTIRYLRHIIALGFIPYLNTAMNFFNSQTGRWIITATMGTVMLGKTSIVVMYSAMMYVFPNALSNLFFPDLISHYENKRYDLFKSSLKKYFLIMSAYVLVTTALTVLVGRPLVELVFPNHIEAMPFVYAIMLSTSLTSLLSPIIISLNAGKRFKEILIGNIISVLSYLLLLVIYITTFHIELTGFFMIESISTFCVFAYNCYVFFGIFLKTIPLKT